MEIGGGGGGSTKETTTTSTATAKAESPAPSSSVSESSSGDSPKDTGAASATATVQETPEIGSPSDLHSGEEAPSNPDNSTEFSQIQAEAAAEAGGEEVVDERVEKYEGLSDQLDQLMAAGPSDPNFYINWENEVRGVQFEMDLMTTNTRGEVAGATAELTDARENLTERVAMVERAQIEIVPFLDDDQTVRFNEYSTNKLEEVTAPFEAATDRFLTATADPLYPGMVSDMPPQEQIDTFNGLAENLPLSEKGREELANIVDGMAGLGDHPLAEVAAEARQKLTGTDLEAFDRALGLITGIDAANRPDGAEARVEAARELLGIGPESTFGQANEAGVNAFSFLQLGQNGATQAAKAAEQAVDLAATRRMLDGPLARNLGMVLGGAGKALDGLGTVLDAVDVVHQVVDGDMLGASSSALGIAQFTMQVLAPRIAEKTAGPVGVITTGIAALQFVNDWKQYPVDFLNPGLDYAMGDDPLRGALYGMDQTMINLYGFDQSQPMRPQLVERLDEVLPSWQTLDALTVGTNFQRLAVPTPIFGG